MKVAVLMMFRDEADIIERCLRNWLAIGVKNFYLCDNASTDNSIGIASDVLSGVNLTMIRETATDWPGRRIINQLHQTAQEDGCDWFFPADADELLQIPKQFSRVQDWLSSYHLPETTYQYGYLPYLNILPDGRSDWQQPHRKVFGKLYQGWSISMGNHEIENANAPELHSLTAYYQHFSLRTYDQFRRKMINYMTAFNQTQFKDHPHSVDFFRWKQQGEDFFVERWNALTQI